MLKISQTSHSINGIDSYIPQTGKIIDVYSMTDREKFFRLQLASPLNHKPGQFVMASVLGVGEAPISITCAPRNDNILARLSHFVV